MGKVYNSDSVRSIYTHNDVLSELVIKDLRFISLVIVESGRYGDISGIIRVQPQLELNEVSAVLVVFAWALVV
jgi:hypothetical protein